MSDTKHVVFVDNIGRTVVGETVNENKTVLEVKNPAVIHVQPNPENGQISVQLIPFFFREFQSGGKNDSVWIFLKSNVTLGKDLALDERLVVQYTNMFSAIQVPPQPALVGVGAPDTSQPPVVKLFDD
jgi:hypothetical protein